MRRTWFCRLLMGFVHVTSSQLSGELVMKSTLFRSMLAGLCLAATAGTVSAQTTNPPPTGGRDWTKIDTNKDGHVSPEEMEKWLKDNPGPLKK
jgi:hypothetical protein